MKSIVKSIFRHKSATIAAIGLTTIAAIAHADAFVVNGGFEQLQQPGVSSQFGTHYPQQQVIGWSTSGYNVVFTSAHVADTTGAPDQFTAINGGINYILYGPDNGYNNGLTASPDGGNFIAFDGENVNGENQNGSGALSQMINGLIPGQSTTVSFYFAGAQAYNEPYDTTEQLAVSLGGATAYTPVLSNPHAGFTGWYQENLTFTPTSSSELLSFVAIGTPSGSPPTVLL